MLKALLRVVGLSLAVILALGLGSAAAADGKTGVVLLHGKYGAPDRHIAALASALRGAGFLVATPEMPWSKRRAYEAGFLAALAEIDLAVRELRAAGASRVVVAGHSLGGNAALAYAAGYPGLDGVLCLAAAHTPDSGRLHEASASDVARAKELVAAGKGDSLVRFTDLNMGMSFEKTATSVVYLSYFDPAGPAVMPLSAAKISPPLPILWVAGARDPLAKPGPEYAFALAPAHPQSRYVVVDADHLGTPTAAIPLALEWLGRLGR